MPGFSQAIREQVLVQAARHCSVCQRYKAVGIEVHHIVPRAEGGEDTEDNAIALCFDCHMAAGHYNPKHPKGTKFSPNELRGHKEQWRRIVASGAISSAESSEELLVTCRHVITSDQSALQNVLQLEKTNLPFGDFERLDLGPPIQHIRDCFAQGSLFRGYMGRRSYTGCLVADDSASYESASKFHDAHPEFGGREERPLRNDDLELLKRQPIWQRALAEGIDATQIGRVFAIHGPDCGGDSWHQEAVFRVPHAVFLQIRNDGVRPVRLQAVRAFRTGSKDRIDFRPLVTVDGGPDHQRIEIPPATILPGHSLLVPEGVFYGPLEDSWFESSNSEQYSGDIEAASELKVQYFIFDPEQQGPFHVTGPWVHIESLDMQLESGPRLIQVHGFDPRKPFVSVDTVWLAGSCPHVFVRTLSGSWRYAGEIFASASSAESPSCITCLIPENISVVRIAELEYETTTLQWIRIDGHSVAETVVLERGDWIEMAVQAGQVLSIRGFYSSLGERIPERQSNMQKHRLLTKGLRELGADRAVGEFGSIWRVGREA